MLSEGLPATLIDQAATDFGMPMGPIELADTVGLDVCLSVGGILGRHFGSPVPARLEELVKQGHLGRKSGQGFYKYRKGKVERPAVPKGHGATDEITDRLILRMLNESVACLREGVVEDANLVDAGMIFGAGFAPFRGGPMHYLKERGRDRVAERLSESRPASVAPIVRTPASHPSNSLLDALRSPTPLPRPRHRAPLHGMKTTRRSLGLVLGVLVLAAACAHRPTPAPGGTSPGQAGTGHPQWDQFVSGFLDQYYKDHPSYAVQLGRHDFDGRLPDWRATALKELAARLRAARTQALAFNALSPNARFERDYLIAHLDRDLFWLEEAGWPRKNPLYYSDALDPNVYVVRAYAPLAERLKAYVGYAKAVPGAVAQIRQNLAGLLPRTYLDLGVTYSAGWRTIMKRRCPRPSRPYPMRHCKRAFGPPTPAPRARCEAWSPGSTASAGKHPDPTPSGPSASARCCGRPRAWTSRSIDWSRPAGTTWRATSAPCGRPVIVISRVATSRPASPGCA